MVGRLLYFCFLVFRKPNPPAKPHPSNTSVDGSGTDVSSKSTPSSRANGSTAGAPAARHDNDAEVLVAV